MFNKIAIRIFTFSLSTGAEPEYITLEVFFVLGVLIAHIIPLLKRTAHLFATILPKMVNFLIIIQLLEITMLKFRKLIPINTGRTVNFDCSNIFQMET